MQPSTAAVTINGILIFLVMSEIFFYTTIAYRYWVRICQIEYENF